VSGDLYHGVARDLAVRVGLFWHRVGERHDGDALLRQKLKVATPRRHAGEQLVHIVKDVLGQHALAVGVFRHIPRLLEHGIVLGIRRLHDLCHGDLLARLVGTQCEQLADLVAVAATHAVDWDVPVDGLREVFLRLLARVGVLWLLAAHQEGAHQLLDADRVVVVLLPHLGFAPEVRHAVGSGPSGFEWVGVGPWPRRLLSYTQ
jgi:hypothetical protein